MNNYSYTTREKKAILNYENFNFVFLKKLKKETSM